jgi:hypothetical protein
MSASSEVGLIADVGRRIEATSSCSFFPVPPTIVPIS